MSEQILLPGVGVAPVGTAQDAPGDVDRIAVVGMACRFPGAADVDAFWRNLLDGVDAITRESPRSAGPDLDDYVPARGRLADPTRFDAAHFGFSPREARVLSPQHRTFLECAVEAMERSGHDPERHQAPIGIYAGGTDIAWSHLLRQHRDRLPAMTDWELLLGSASDFMVSRVAYKLGLRGPAVTVQAACATSLVAVHTAIQGLLAGDCDFALAGGAAVHVPGKESPWRPGGIISKHGVCRAFDAEADGTVGGDGVGLVVLRRLEDAQRDGDHVHAVIRGTAVTNDGGRGVGFTAPSVDGQRAAIREAQLVADVNARTIGYVETHGTGTPLGDPIEIRALTGAFGEDTDDIGFCRIGSVKSGIGHTDAAAGAAGLIKAVLAVEHGTIPASLHCGQPSARLGLDRTPFRVATSTQPWPAIAGPRRAGVSAFGIGGTNAHVILEEAAPLAEAPIADPGWQLLPLSASTPSALQTVARQLADHLRAHPAVDLADVAWTLQLGRRELSQRRFVLARDRDEAIVALMVDCGDTAVNAPVDDDSWRKWSGLGDDWLAGATVDWERAHPRVRCRVALPTYPFEREPYELDLDPDTTAVVESADRSSMATDDPVAVLRTLFGEVLGVSSVAADDDFFELGGDSLISISLLGRVRETLGVVVDPAALSSASTPTRLAARLNVPAVVKPSAGGEPEGEWLAARAARPDAPIRLYVFPHAGGGAAEYVRWADVLDQADVQVIQLPGRGQRADEPALREIPDVVDALLAEVEFEAPFAFFGHSMGALIAAEVAWALQERGRQTPEHLFLSSCPPPDVAGRASTPGHQVVAMHELDDDRMLAEMERRWGALPAQLHESAELRALVLGPTRADLEAFTRYQYVPREPLRAGVTLLGGEDERDEIDLEGWSAHAAEVTAIHYLPGGHFYHRDRGVRDRLLTAVAGRLSQAVTASVPGVAFLFPGQGSQRARMGLRLAAAVPLFAAAYDAALDLVRDSGGLDLRPLLHAGDALERTEITQPALFAVEYALARTWQRLGVEPTVMLGHSIGEYVAATLAGVFTPGDAARVVCLRGRLMGAAPPGAMLSVALSEAALAPYLERGLDLAAVNGPDACVLAGPHDVVDTIAAEFTAMGVPGRRLAVSHAYHSRAMASAADRLADFMAGTELAAPQIPYYSNVTGRPITAQVVRDPAYWARHLRSTVRFDDGLAALLATGPQAVVEVGPGQTLTTLARRSAARPMEVAVTASFPRAGEPEQKALLNAVLGLREAGAPVDWDALW